ncbi:glucosyltransferase domain-containing protein [Commensalibacter nepenthis]|uniref:Glucosyltransferase domain-containing protein n=1 Tax=Commensalibacter nepenthis TaxID=3043872 RepID=A0ABT6Q908_9PROT|nr:glucosyltransferase domain-containing protein [Commensalibacter sp. TBRC 10068]MDI2113390.1 glucosyltransferase domain-containing protein [Commensalibacter sp. TBRC 10068]
MKYRDDYIRVLFLNLGWVGEGRFISKWIINFFTFSDGVYTAPLTQILSLACITFTILYSAQTLFKKIDFYSCSLISLIFLNPFYLQNMSFGYDSLPMTIATCCAVISALLIIRTKYYIPLTALLTFIIIFSYQTTIGIYVNTLVFVLFIYYLQNNWNNEQKIYIKALISLGIYFLFCFIYKQTYPYLFGGSADRIIINLANVKTNILQTISYIKLLFFKSNYLFYITAVVTFLSFVVFQYQQIKKKQIKPIHIVINFAIVCLIYSIFLLTAEGASLLFKTDISDVRLLIAVSFLWVFSFYIISLASRTLYYIFYFLFCCFCFSFSYSYGNFLKDQNQFFDMTMTNISYDIGHTPNISSAQIFVLNPFPLSESNQKLASRIPLFLPLYGEQNFDWLIAVKMSTILPYTFSGDTKKMCQFTTELASIGNTNIHSIKTKIYTLYFYQGNIFIDFHTAKKDFCKM